ncbi:hypothetical protein RFI_01393 [Reticulomyxa filosa]|uniref:Endonuclease/exonuclease/phosphatase domain-containing protein n=1 Tax=Reticulomyxa filosa TaxID=46433 RepID=X6PBW6_RETFI|nr:hypothetical protein RFI_01393 [Reticulomyxa filosa]|eukprot:ETO35671.1 hypothetical protein RFI_01393 [Reticulomyxa filosa]
MLKSTEEVAPEIKTKNDNSKNKPNESEEKTKESGEKGSRTLKLMTFNLRNSNLDESNETSQSKNVRSWRNIRRQLCQEMIEQYKPDIICTQEGNLVQLSQFTQDINRIKQYNTFGQGRSPQKYYNSNISDRINEYCNIFWDTNQLELMDGGTFHLSDKPTVVGSKFNESSLPRIVTWVLLHPLYQSTSTLLLIVNCHLDHIGHNARHKQLALLKKFILQDFVNDFASRANGCFIDTTTTTKKKKRDNVPLFDKNQNISIFCTGDFNDEMFISDLWKKGIDPEITKELLFNCINIQDKSHNARLHTFHNWIGDQFDSQKFPIDWVLCNKNIWNVMTFRRCEIIKFNKDGVFPSDHYPVIVEMLWKTSQ